MIAWSTSDVDDLCSWLMTSHVRLCAAALQCSNKDLNNTLRSSKTTHALKLFVAFTACHPRHDNSSHACKIMTLLPRMQSLVLLKLELQCSVQALYFEVERILWLEAVATRSRSKTAKCILLPAAGSQSRRRVFGLIQYGPLYYYVVIGFGN